MHGKRLYSSKWLNRPSLLSGSGSPPANNVERALTNKMSQKAHKKHRLRTRGQATMLANERRRFLQNDPLTSFFLEFPRSDTPHDSMPQARHRMHDSARNPAPPAASTKNPKTTSKTDFQIVGFSPLHTAGASQKSPVQLSLNRTTTRFLASKPRALAARGGSNNLE